MPPPRVVYVASALGLALALALNSASGRAARQPAAPPAEPAAPKLQDLPPIIRLGLRAESIRQQSQVTPTVVIVPDTDSFLAAIAEWRPRKRFPILIDDGSWNAREHAARFIRAFAPARVVRWKAPEPAPWPEPRAEREAILRTTLARAWAADAGTESPDQPDAIVKLYAKLNWTPLGIVATSVDDPAWPAALALAAGHGQLLTFLEQPADAWGGINAQLPMSAATAIDAALLSACVAAGVPHRGLGEGIDALTLALALPTRVKTPADDGAPQSPRGPFVAPPNTPLATSDVLGRLGGHGERWAFAAQLWGTSAESLYRAMAALFLQPTDAWLFDGYDQTAGWKAYDAGESAAVLKQANISPTVDDTPRQGLTDFRDRAAGAFVPRRDPKREPPTEPPAEAGRPRPTPEPPPQSTRPPGGIRAGLIAVNTSGQLNLFELKPGNGISADVPTLDIPSLVYFVHSFSAQQPGDRWTIAGRFLDRGAFAYVGSVEEPFLSAFIPTPNFFRRLLGPVPLGAAARLDNAPAWRIAVLGDPLYTLGPPAPRGDPLLPIAAVTDLAESLPEWLKARDWPQVFPALILLNRDRDAVRLASALLKDDPAALTPALAALAAAAAFRTVDFDPFCALYEKSMLTAEAPPALVDMAWHAFWPNISRLGPERVGLLGASLRAECFERDADEAARAYRRVAGDGPRRRWLEQQLTQTTDKARQAVLQRLIDAPAAGK